MVLNTIIDKKLGELKVCELLHESYQIKLKLLNSDRANKNEYELNESFIEEHTTQFKILKLKDFIESKKKDISMNFQIYFEELEEQWNK